jgi:hypothetical protein
VATDANHDDSQFETLRQTMQSIQQCVSKLDHEEIKTGCHGH